MKKLVLYYIAKHCGRNVYQRLSGPFNTAEDARKDLEYDELRGDHEILTVVIEAI